MQSKDLRLATELDLETSIVAVTAPIDQRLEDLEVSAGFNPGNINDTTAASLIRNIESETRTELAAAIGGQAAAQRFVSSMDSEAADLAILIPSDSTANEPSEWARRFGVGLGLRYPRWTIHERLWNDTTLVYDAATAIQSGTNGRTLTVYLCAVAGATTAYFTGAKFQPAIGAVDADLVILSMGHNEGSFAPLWWPQYTAFVESIAEAQQGASMVLIGQNPAMANNYQAERAELYREIAATRGFGFIDVHKAFTDTGNVAAFLNSVDKLHPNDAGSQLWADTVLAAFRPTPARSLLGANTPTLLASATDFAPNGRFESFSASVPDGWTLTAGTATATKDTTNFETGTYAVKVTSTSAGGAMRLELPPADFSGRWVTVAARVYVGAAQAASAGRVMLQDDSGALTTNPVVWGRDGFRWVTVTKFVPPTATFLRIHLYGDTSVAGGAATYDQASVTVGKFPHRANPAPIAATGSGGGTVAGLDFLSTVGNIPAIAAQISTTEVTVPAANVGMMLPIIPHRNIAVTGIAWLSGTVTGGNYDIGIYDKAGGRLWSKGAAAWPAINTRSVIAVPSVALVAGETYWVAFSADNNTSTIRGSIESFVDLSLTVDGKQTAKSTGSGGYPLPASRAIDLLGRAGRFPVITLHGI